MRTGAVIVAAGMSSRMGEFKPLLQLGGLTFVQRVVSNFQQAKVFPIVVVTGYRAQELERHLARLGVVCVRNPDYARSEMSDSARLGFQYILDKCDRVFFTPVDIPLFTCGTVQRLMDSPAPVAKPVCGGRAGHPVLLSRPVVERVLQSPAQGGLGRAIARCAPFTELVPVEDGGVLLDADTPADYRQLLERHNRQLLRPVVSVSLMREGLLLDQRAALLLHLVASDGTMKEACERLGISYSKGWGLLRQLEETLGFPLLQRQPGGEYGGSSRLTLQGQRLLGRYEAYAQAVQEFAGQAFARFFPEEPSAPPAEGQGPAERAQEKEETA